MRTIRHICVLGITSLFTLSCAPDTPPGLGDRVPNGELQMVDATGSSFEVGQRLRLSQLEGKPVLLDFWATWCQPCKAQHTYVTELKAKYGDRIEVLGVLFQDDPQNVERWIGLNGTTYATASEPRGDLSKAFRINGIPRLVLVTADRRLAWDMLGGWGKDSLEIRLDDMVGN